jgi:hypothetical protein
MVITSEVTTGGSTPEGNGLFFINGVESLRLAASANVGIKSSSVTQALTVTGNILASGNITAFSDERLKTNIRDVTGAIEIIERLRGRRFIKDGKENIGVIAQETQLVLPELVSTEDEYLSVNYSGFVGVLIEAVKELSAKVRELENR